MALTYYLGAGGKLGKLKTGPTAIVPLPVAQACSFQNALSTQTYKNRALISTYPVKGVTSGGIAIFEASIIHRGTRWQGQQSTHLQTHLRARHNFVLRCWRNANDTDTCFSGCQP